MKYLKLIPLLIAALTALTLTPGALAGDKAWDSSSTANWSTGPWSPTGNPATGDTIVTPLQRGQLSIDGNYTVAGWAVTNTGNWTIRANTVGAERTLTISGNMGFGGAGSANSSYNFYNNTTAGALLNVAVGGTLDLKQASGSVVVAFGNATTAGEAGVIKSVVVTGETSLEPSTALRLNAYTAQFNGGINFNASVGNGGTFSLLQVPDGNLAPGTYNPVEVAHLRSTASTTGGTVQANALASDLTATTNAVLSINGNTGAVNTYNGQIRNSANPSISNTATLSIRKSGNNVQVFTFANTYSGGTTISGGTLRGGNNSAFGTGTLKLDGGTIASDSSTARTFANAVTIGGDVTFGETSTGTGALTFSSTATNNLGSSTRTLTVNQATELAGALGNGNITKEGSAALTLNNAGSSFGTLTANAGTVIISNGAAVTGLGGTAGALNITNSTLTVSNSTAASFGGVMSGSGGLTKAGSHTLTLSGTGANTYSGTTTVSGGTLNLNKTGVNAIAGAVSVSSTATLLISASGQVSDTSAVTLSGGTITRGTAVSEVFGDINITSASFLDFGSGATGTFQFQAYANAGNSMITVNNFAEGNKLQFHTNSFTVANLAQFTFSGGTTTSIEGNYFTITAIPEPSTVVAAAGLLGLMLWPLRRRFTGRSARA